MAADADSNEGCMMLLQQGSYHINIIINEKYLYAILLLLD
jgi:hypothetical protein